MVNTGIETLSEIRSGMPDGYITEDHAQRRLLNKYLYSELPSSHPVCPCCGKPAISVSGKWYCDSCYKNNRKILDEYRRPTGLESRKNEFIRNVLIPDYVNSSLEKLLTAGA